MKKLSYLDKTRANKSLFEISADTCVKATCKSAALRLDVACDKIYNRAHINNACDNTLALKYKILEGNRQDHLYQG